MPGGSFPVVFFHACAAPRSATRRATAMPAPLATAHDSAFGHVVPGAAGLRGGSSPCVFCHVVSRSFLLVLAATSPLVMPTTFQPTLAPAIAVSSRSVLLSLPRARLRTHGLEQVTRPPRADDP